jgi:hypothetical protein
MAGVRSVDAKIAKGKRENAKEKANAKGMD